MIFEFNQYVQYLQQATYSPDTLVDFQRTIAMYTIHSSCYSPLLCVLHNIASRYIITNRATLYSYSYIMTTSYLLSFKVIFSHIDVTCYRSYIILYSLYHIVLE
jgi:hypothetical protein